VTEIPESQVEVDAGHILEAAVPAVTFWPTTRCTPRTAEASAQERAGDDQIGRQAELVIVGGMMVCSSGNQPRLE
jgi:hypothetical protein